MKKIKTCASCDLTETKTNRLDKDGFCQACHAEERAQLTYHEITEFFSKLIREGKVVKGQVEIVRDIVVIRAKLR